MHEHEVRIVPTTMAQISDAVMLLYELAWVRYFRGGEKLAGMYASLGPIPVPLASLPVAAFGLLGVWCQSPVAVISAVILGIGHVGIHLGHLPVH
ncbi:MAG: hypothetical protein KH372_09140 [Olsenella uli]|uniref:hypothetical protein n=1 Tax=Olsenella uli TaxID=133926 RepID=UPI001D71A7B1|nr:hypothetical protein [Olsenella uli]MBS6418967.1 hypothetical protein [Olsenella uli]